MDTRHESPNHTAHVITVSEQSDMKS